MHPEFIDSGKQPVQAYSSKGKLDARLYDETLAAGYKALVPILPDILELHDFLYVNLPKWYDIYTKDTKNRASKLGRREGFRSLRGTDAKLILPLTKTETSYQIDNGILYPLLSSARGLYRLKKTGEAVWRCSVFNFFQKHGPFLVGQLIEALEAEGSSNKFGKEPRNYSALYKEVQLILAKERDATVED